MRKKLAVAELCGLIIAAILPLLENMFIWTKYSYVTSKNYSKEGMSLNNLMTIQQISGGPFLYYVFYAFIIITAIYCVAQLFSDHSILQNKATIALPGGSFILALIMLIGCDLHTHNFNYRGELRSVYVSWDVLAYIFLIVLAVVFVIECYKQFKCND